MNLTRFALNKFLPSIYLWNWWCYAPSIITCNSEFCFPETLNWGRGEIFPVSYGTSNYVFCYTSQLRKIWKEIICMMLAGSQICRTLEVHDSMAITCPSCCFPRELVSIGHVLLQSENILVWRYHNISCLLSSLLLLLLLPPLSSLASNYEFKHRLSLFSPWKKPW